MVDDLARDCSDVLNLVLQPIVLCGPLHSRLLRGGREGGVLVLAYLNAHLTCAAMLSACSYSTTGTLSVGRPDYSTALWLKELPTYTPCLVVSVSKECFVWMQ